MPEALDHPATLLRRMTAAATVRALRAGGVMTVAEIARTAGLSRPTVASQIEDLVQQGWVQESGTGTGTTGRPARRFRFHARAGFVLGIDIGAHTVRAVLADLDGSTIQSRRVAVTPQLGSAERIESARAAARQAMDEARISRHMLLGATVGTPGIINREGRVTMSVLPDWTGVDLAGRIGRFLACSTEADNDANLATLAEHWRGASREADNVVQVLAGRRTGAGLLLDGRLHRGRVGAAGEIGALDFIGWDQAPRELIAAAGADADPDRAAATLFTAAAAGDPHAREVTDRFARLLAQGIAAMVLTVDPDMVVVGGGVSLAGAALLTPLVRELDRLCLDTPPVRISELGDEAVVLGAVRHALDAVEQRLFTVDTAALL